MSKPSALLSELSESTDADRGVSPVVGVVLMIVLAVSLTVVVGGFTSDLVDRAAVDAPPQATLNVYNNGDGDGIRVAHDGGADLVFDEIEVVVRKSNGQEIDASDLDFSEASSELTPGDTFVVESTEFSNETEYEVIVIDDASGKVIDDGVVEYQE